MISSDIARRDEWLAAFQIIFQDIPGNERADRVAPAFRLVQQGELDPQGIFVVRNEKQILAALVCLKLPGATGLVWPPRTQPGLLSSAAYEDELMTRAIAWLRQRGAR